MPKRVVFLSDGSKWLRSVKLNEFPFATAILDFYHATEHLEPVLVAMGFKKGTKKYRSTSVGIFTVFAFLFGGLSGVVMGALSQRYGVRGFEIGFMLTGASYVVGALFVMYGFLFTFKRDSISEHSTAAGNSL